MATVLGKLRHYADRQPCAVALRGDRESLSYARLDAHATNLAHVLEHLGVRVLALVADNSPDWIAVDFAAQIAGVTLVPVPPFFSSAQVRHVIRDSGADALVADTTVQADIRACNARFVTDVADDLRLWHLDGAVTKRLPPGTAKISYASGSTGRPRGVCLAQATLDRVAASLCLATDGLGVERHLCLLPLAVLLENVAGVYAPLLNGIEIAVPSLARSGYTRGVDAAALAASINEAEPQSIVLLPQTLAGLVGAVENGTKLAPTLRFAAIDGGFVGTRLLQRAERLRLPVYEGYGLTESGSVVALNTPKAHRPGSAGRPLAHIGLRIGPRSEVFVSGAGMNGYLDDATDADTTDGHSEIATGEIGFLDDDGFLFLKGRQENVFTTSFGHNISPESVEAELASTNSIAQAALFGEARPWNVAVIVPAARGVRPDEIDRDVAAVNRRLPGYAQVCRWVLARAPFTASNGLLTLNGRNRRAAIGYAYENEIAASYAARTGSYD